MQLKSVVFAATNIVAILALEGRANTTPLPVHTAIKVYHTIINKSPFMVDRTSTIVWTESASISDSTLVTTAPTPTIGY